MVENTRLTRRNGSNVFELLKLTTSSGKWRQVGNLLPPALSQTLLFVRVFTDPVKGAMLATSYTATAAASARPLKRPRQEVSFINMEIRTYLYLLYETRDELTELPSTALLNPRESNQTCKPIGV